MTANGYAIFNKITEKFKYGTHWLDSFAQLYRKKSEAKKDINLIENNEHLEIIEFVSKELNYSWDFLIQPKKFKQYIKNADNFSIDNALLQKYKLEKLAIQTQDIENFVNKSPENDYKTKSSMFLLLVNFREYLLEKSKK